MVSAAFKSVPQTTATTFAFFLSLPFFYVWNQTMQSNHAWLIYNYYTGGSHPSIICPPGIKIITYSWSNVYTLIYPIISILSFKLTSIMWYFRTLHANTSDRVTPILQNASCQYFRTQHANTSERDMPILQNATRQRQRNQSVLQGNAQD